MLEDVSIDVQPGEMIGLVGHSGAGKSTIINLLSRFYDVKDGQILIDGVDIRNIKMDDLRRQIGVVLAGAVPVPRHDRQQHRLCQAGRNARRDHAGRQSRQCP